MAISVSTIVNREWRHPNLTIAKAVRFGLGYVLVWPLGLLLLWLLTEKVGLWYMYSSVLAGAFSAGLRFFMAAFVFGKKGEA